MDGVPLSGGNTQSGVRGFTSLGEGLPRNPFEADYDALRGLVLEGTHQNKSLKPTHFTGFTVEGVGTDIQEIKLHNNKKLILVPRNKDRILVFELN